jgi:hypothetical protein
MHTDTDTRRELALRSISLMADGTLEDFEEVLHPEFLNHEQKDEPPAARGIGPATAYATALWLRDAMHGRHVRPFISYDADANVGEVFPPTGKSFASTQTHWLRIKDDKVIEHWANRDDLGMAVELGWVPPTPLYLIRQALAKRRARRAAG